MVEHDIVPYKDISDLKKELAGMRAKKSISTDDLNESVQKLAQTMSDMLEVFDAAARQMNIEERENATDIKKHEMILSRLEKLTDQNKTIADGMVAIVDMVKEKIVEPKKKEQHLFKHEEPMPLFKSKKKPTMAPPMPTPKPVMPEPMMSPQMMDEPMPHPQTLTPPMPPPSMPSTAPPGDFGSDLPPIEPGPPPDLDLPEESLGSKPKKKGLFGMFKK